MLLTHNEMHNKPGIANLMRWIDSHDRPALTRFDTTSGLLHVASVTISADIVVDTIPATLAAARDLLGY